MDQLTCRLHLHYQSKLNKNKQGFESIQDYLHIKDTPVQLYQYQILKKDTKTQLNLVCVPICVDLALGLQQGTRQCKITIPVQSGLKMSQSAFPSMSAAFYSSISRFMTMGNQAH